MRALEKRHFGGSMMKYLRRKMRCSSCHRTEPFFVELERPRVDRMLCIATAGLYRVLVQPWRCGTCGRPRRFPFSLTPWRHENA
jgi:hypothetical protein